MPNYFWPVILGMVVLFAVIHVAASILAYELTRRRLEQTYRILRASYTEADELMVRLIDEYKRTGKPPTAAPPP